MSPWEAIAVCSIVVVAACVQGAIGFGMALIAAPLLVLIEPRLVPGPLMASVLVLVLFVAFRDRRHADLRNVRWALLGYAAGAAVGVTVLVSLDVMGFQVLFGVLVLVGVALSALGLRVRVTAGSAVGAGLLGGFMGSTTAIGGPPVAMLYQHEDADRIRGTLSAYFVLTSCVGLTALATVGRFGTAELGLALYLLPGSLAGFAISGRVVPLLSRAGVRPILLGLSAVAGCAVLGRAVLVGS